jgi:hypothetical protein
MGGGGGSTNARAAEAPRPPDNDFEPLSEANYDLGGNDFGVSDADSRDAGLSGGGWPERLGVDSDNGSGAICLAADTANSRILRTPFLTFFCGTTSTAPRLSEADADHLMYLPINPPRCKSSNDGHQCFEGHRHAADCAYQRCHQQVFGGLDNLSRSVPVTAGPHGSKLCRPARKALAPLPVRGSSTHFPYSFVGGI